MELENCFQGCIDLTAETDLAQATAILPAGPGVGLFADERHKPILLLPSARLRGLVRRRLQHPEDAATTRRTDLAAITRHVWYQTTSSAFETQWAFWQRARQLYPHNLQELMGKPYVWFLHVNPAESLARFAVAAKLTAPGRYWGPYPDKKGPQHIIETLIDIFGLCRKNHPGRERCQTSSCVYAQMGRCKALLDGQLDEDRHRRLIDQAMDFLARPIEDNLRLLRENMAAASANLDFEQAQNIKEKLALAENLINHKYPYINELSQLCILAFQPGPKVLKPGAKRGKTATIAPFIIRAAHVEQCEPFTQDQTGPACENLLERCRQEAHKPFLSNELHLLNWVTRFLYGSQTTEGLYLPFAASLTPETIAAQVKKHFESQLSVDKEDTNNIPVETEINDA